MFKNKDKIIEYYTGVFEALKSSGSTYYQEHTTSREKAEAVYNDEGLFQSRFLSARLANLVGSKGKLNCGICPECGALPIGKDSSWKYYYTWNNGPTLYLCKECYDKGVDRNKQYQKQSKCFVATAVYADEYSNHLYVFRSFRDKILLKSYFGKVFVGIYYIVSPFLVKSFIKTPTTKDFIKRRILNPLSKAITDKHDF